MKALKYGLYLALFATSVAHGYTNASSEYTPLTEEHCPSIINDDGLYSAQCPAKAGYELQVIGADLRYGLNVSYGDTTVSYQPMLPFNIGKVAEWRYRKEGEHKNYHALIYRVYTAKAEVSDGELKFLPRSQDKQELIVVRLQQEGTCLLGVIEQSHNMNQLARNLADDPNACCL